MTVSDLGLLKEWNRQSETLAWFLTTLFHSGAGG